MLYVLGKCLKILLKICHYMNEKQFKSQHVTLVSYLSNCPKQYGIDTALKLIEK